MLHATTSLLIYQIQRCQLHFHAAFASFISQCAYKQRRSSIFILCLDVGFSLPQSSCHCIITQSCCLMQWRCSVSVICINVGLVLEKDLDQCLMPFDGCGVQGRYSILIPSIDVHSIVHQWSHYLKVSIKPYKVLNRALWNEDRNSQL